MAASRLPLARVALLAPLFCACNSGSVLDPSRPVVVLVTLDTTRADYLGCYGSAGPQSSPRIDALAADGVLFQTSISQAAVTPVSHASIMTGLYPYHHGLRVMHGRAQNRLTEGQVTLAEILSEKGYDTGAFVSAFPVTQYFGFAQGFDHFDAEFTPPNAAATQIHKGMVNTGAVQRHAGETTERALRWMEQRETPFLLWLHYFDTHDEQVVPPGGVPPEVSQISDAREQRRALYRYELTYMDSQLGLVFDKLKQLGLWDNSVIVVTADHGEGLGDHDWWTHGILYQEQVHVPLIIRAPGLGGGQRVAPVVRSIDIVPTIAELLHIMPDDLPPLDGTSLVPLMDGRSQDLGLQAYSDSVNTLVYRVAPGFFDNKNDLLFALVLDNRWKYICHLKERQASELYDLQEDPGELRNLAQEQPEQMQRARQALLAIDFLPVQQLELTHTPPQVLRALEALGYSGAAEPQAPQPPEPAGSDD